MNFLKIDRKKIPALVDELNTLLANQQIQYQKLRNFHWNIKGENFFELHELFEQMYTDQQKRIDNIAERIQTLKYRPLSLLKKYLERAEVKEVDAFLSDVEMVKEILQDNAVMIENIERAANKAQEAGDGATLHFLRDIQLKTEKMSWMLDTWYSHTQVKKGEPSKIA